MSHLKRLIRSFTKVTFVMQRNVFFLLLALISGCITQSVPEQCVSENFQTRSSKLRPTDFHRLVKPPFANQEREQRVVQYFGAVCPLLLMQKIGEHAAHNVICRIEGTHDFKIVVGAHYDRIGGGRGVADNWSGIVLVSRLIAELKLIMPRATWEIIAFGEEESAVLGSKSYVRNNDTDGIIAMINVDTLGMDTVRVDSRSDRRLKCIAKDLANRIGIKLSTASLPGTGGDWEPFKRRGISVLNIHSMDSRSMRKVHTRKDTERSVSTASMQDAWLFLLNLSLYIDQESGQVFKIRNPGI